MAAERIEHLLLAAYPQSRELFEGAGEWLEREIGQYIMSRSYDLDAPEALTKKFLSSIQGQFKALRAPHQEAFKSWLREFSAGDFADQSRARTTALSQLASLLEASGRYTEPAQPPTAHQAPTAATRVPATGPSASASTTPSGAQQRAPRVEESSTASKPERTVFVVELECTDRALFELLAAALGKTVVGASTTVLETDCDALSYQLQLHSNGHTAYQQAGRRSQVPSLFGRVCVQQPARKSSGEDIPPSFDKPFEYDYFPAEMLSVSVACALKYERLVSAFDARPKNSALAAQTVAKFMKENNLSTKLRLTLVSSVGTRLTGEEAEEQRTLAARFCRYLRWCQSPKRRRFAFVEAAAIDRALARVKEEMIGVETLIEREMGPLMKEFAHVDASMPHGVLLYGPPGTGKTTIIDKLMLYMDIVPVCPAMAAGDFNKPYRGEGEAMVKHLGERAAAVPWQAVGVSIDEIDGLAPQRGESDSGGKVDLLSVLLSVVGGNQDVKNLILFGSTNRFASMDEAFRRRMGKKFFVGRPSFEARRKWMLWKMCQYALPIGCMEVLNVVRDVRQRLGLNSPDDLDRLDRQPSLVLPTICSMRLPPATEEQLTWLQSLTINFSNDAMRVLLSSMHIARCSAGLSNAKHPFERNELQWFAEQVAKAERIFLGNDVVPDLFADSVNAISTGAEQYERLRELKDNAKRGVVGQPDTPLCGREFRATRFMLVDSGSQPSSQIQVQFVTGGHNNLERNNLIAALRQAFPPAQAITPEQMCATLGLFVQQHLTKEECVALQKACSWRNLVTVGDLAEKIIQLTRVIHACYVTDPHYWRGGKANERILGELGRPSPFVTGAAWQIWQSAPERIQESRRHVFEAIEHVRQFGTMTRTSTSIGISTGFGNFFAVPAPPLFDVRDQLNRTYDFNDAVASEARALREAVRVLLARVEDTTARFYMVDHYGPLCASLLTRQEIMFVLTDLAINLKLEALYVVDSETLVRNRTVSDEEAQMYLHMVSDEARQYASSMVIVDLQSLVSPSKSYDAMTNDSTRSSLALERRVSAAPAGATDDEREARKLDDEAGPAFRYELTRPGVLAMVQRMVQQQTSVDTPHWLVVLTEDLYLTSRVKQCFYEHQWPLTPEEEQTRERNREMRRRRTCVVCHEEYTEEENSARMSCSRHTGQLRLEYVYKGKTEHLQFSTAAAFDRKMAELSQMEPPPEVKDARWFCCGNRPHDRGERPARHTDACGESHPDQARDGKQFCVSCGQKLK